LSITAQGTVDFIDSMDKLFDLFNSCSSASEQPEVYHVKPFNSPLKKLIFQTEYLNKMSKFFLNLQI